MISNFGTIELSSYDKLHGLTISLDRFDIILW